MSDPKLPLAEVVRRLRSGEDVPAVDLLRLAEAFEEANEGPAGIDIESGVSHRTGGPFIRLRWGPLEAQLSPAEARAHAMGILEAVEAATSDAFLAHWIVEKLGGGPAQAAGILMDFRAWREAQA